MKSVLVFILFLPLLVCGQHFSKLGRFSIEYAQGCLPATVHVTEYTDPNNPTTFYFGGSETIDTIYTFTQAGIFEIVQLLGEEVDQRYDTLFFEVIDSPKPQYDYFFCSDNEAKLVIYENPFDSIDITYNHSTITISGKKEQHLTIPFIDSISITIQGKYKFAPAVNCGFTEFLIQSNRQSSSVLSLDNYSWQVNCNGLMTLDMSFQNENNYWNSITLKNHTGDSVIYEGPEVNYLSIENLPTRFALDTTLLTSELISICDTSTISQLSYTLLPIEETDLYFTGAYASVKNNQTIIQTGTNHGETVSLLETNKGIQRLIDQSNSGTFKVPNTSDSEYMLMLRNISCDSNAVTVKAPFLKMTADFDINNQYNIEYNRPIHHINALDSNIHMVIFNQDSTITIQEDLTNNIQLSSDLGINQFAFILYEYFTADNFYSIASNTVRLVYKLNLSYPTAFSPNDDGINDIYKIIGIPKQATGELKIFNRWGQLVFETNHPFSGWDGTQNGQKCPQGTYRFQLTLSETRLQQNNLVGTFVLLR